MAIFRIQHIAVADLVDRHITLSKGRFACETRGVRLHQIPKQRLQVSIIFLGIEQHHILVRKGSHIGIERVSSGVCADIRDRYSFIVVIFQEPFEQQ